MVADSSSVMHSTESIGCRRTVTRILKTDLQHFVEREGIAFVDVRDQLAVGMLMARRCRLMETHKCDECINLGERERLDSRKLGERFVKASHVLCEPSRGVVFDGHALLN